MIQNLAEKTLLRDVRALIKPCADLEVLKPLESLTRYWEVDKDFRLKRALVFFGRNKYSLGLVPSGALVPKDYLLDSSGLGDVLFITFNHIAGRLQLSYKRELRLFFGDKYLLINDFLYNLIKLRMENCVNI